ncbi:hypothetical protein [Clostridium omnivorum]|uniref:Uncharacterized protein n=1 Tax=Clostridium omnivorum TaxID=1604902 RepID=A0ABQ5NCI5_9CLOT|nr:hypothetical protein [Clostridium sp. E14]GLC32897.1 hypothetical protein bsdE14_43070 [Clostridium sp. E14]
MKKHEFLNKVVEVYFSGNYTAEEAIEKVKKDSNISNEEYINLFGRSNSNEVCPSLYE